MRFLSHASLCPQKMGKSSTQLEIVLLIDRLKQYSKRIHSFFSFFFLPPFVRNAITKVSCDRTLGCRYTTRIAGCLSFARRNIGVIIMRTTIGTSRTVSKMFRRKIRISVSDCLCSLWWIQGRFKISAEGIRYLQRSAVTRCHY